MAWSSWRFGLVLQVAVLSWALFAHAILTLAAIDDDGDSLVNGLRHPTDRKASSSSSTFAAAAASGDANVALEHQHRNSNVLIVSTLDGYVTALDPEDDGRVLWRRETKPGSMLSSTISQLELTNQAKWVRLIPSLAGGLYKFDGETVEAVPLSAETLLRSSFKFADNTVITGGKESRTYGIEMDSGRIKYECSIDGCEKASESDDTMDDVLVVQRETQTVRALEPRTGMEKWNFSVRSEIRPEIERGW